MSGPSPEAIALDASLWDEPTTGISLYTRWLAKGLEELGVEVTRVGARHSGQLPRGKISRSLFTLGPLPRLLTGLPQPLYHAVSNFNLPLTRVPGKALVLTVHDLIPDLLPETVSRSFRWQFRLWLSRSLRVADRVICVSTRTREDLLARFEVEPERVVSVHLGVDHVDQIARPDSAGLAYLAALGLPKSFVLYAGALDARKNIELVLQGCERLRAAGRPVTLVLAGQRWFGAGPLEKRIATLRAEGFDIRPLGYQSTEVFYELMRRASVFVFPSLYEGFGLPPLEAMRLGIPTIVSTGGSLPEVCGGGAIVVRPDDPVGLANEITQLLDSPERSAHWSAKGKAHAAGFSWKRTAEQTLSVYRSALSGR